MRDRISEIKARLNGSSCTDDCLLGNLMQPEDCAACAMFANAPSDIRYLLDEVARLRSTLNRIASLSPGCTASADLAIEAARGVPSPQRYAAPSEPSATQTQPGEWLRCNPGSSRARLSCTPIGAPSVACGI